MSNTAPAKQVCKPKKLPFVIMCILSAIVAVLNVLLCVLVPKYYTTINSFLYKGPDADKVAAFRQASADMTQKVESESSSAVFSVCSIKRTPSSPTEKTIAIPVGARFAFC